MPDPVVAVACQGTTPDGTYWAEFGEGTPIVLIHGVGMNHQVWLPQVADLSAGFRVIVYDMLGHGRSRVPDARVTIRDFGTQLEQLLASIDVDRVTLVGHSMGAMVALWFALEHPRFVSGLVALNAVDERTPEQRAAVIERADSLARNGGDTGIDHTLARWFGQNGEAVDPAIHARVREWLQATDPEGYRRAYQVFATADREIAARIHELAVPALFMTGEHDPNSTPAMAASMAARSARGEVDVVADARHMMALEMPAVVNHKVRTFVQQHTGNG